MKFKNKLKYPNGSECLDCALTNMGLIFSAILCFSLQHRFVGLSQCYLAYNGSCHTLVWLTPCTANGGKSKPKLLYISETIYIIPY